MNQKLKLAIAALLAALLEDLNATPAATQTPAKVGPVKPAKAAKVVEPEPEPEAEEPTPEPEAEAEEVPAEEPEAPTLEGLRELASTLLTAGRKAEAVAVLKKYKVAALKELNAKHYPAVHAALTALVESE